MAGGFDYTDFLAMKGTFQGRIFLLGSGASLLGLTDQDKAALAKEYTFGGSRLFLWKELGFIPSFYVIAEEAHTMQAEMFDGVKATIARFWVTWQPAPETWTPVPRPPHHGHDVLHNGMFGLDAQCDLGAELGPHLHHGKDIPLAMAQIAHFLGFTDMYLVGCETTTKGHVFNPSDARTAHAPGITLPYYARAAQEVHITDCTPGGSLTQSGTLEYQPLAEVLEEQA